MKSEKNILTRLNGVLANELIAINQYFLHARMYKHFGFKALNDHEYGQSIQKMKHADWLIERILLLEGLPNLQDLGRLQIGEHCQEMLTADINYEVNAVAMLKTAITYCESKQDFVSRKLLNKILTNTEEQVDWLESQQYLIAQMGIENYLQSQC